MNRNREMNVADLIVRLEEPYKKNKRQTSNKVKREKKKEMTKQAKICRRLSARGNTSIQSDDEDEDADDEDADIDQPDESFYSSVLPNICNICGEIFNSIKGRKDHMKTSSRKHKGKQYYKYECPEPKCGCYYASEVDLKIHRDLEKH